MEISKIDIKNGIVKTLEGRPNTSCRKENLTKEVLRTLQIRLIGNKRIIFQGKLNMACSDLERAKIVQKYKTRTNTRVRLTKDYLKHYTRLKRKWEKQELKKQQLGNSPEGNIISHGESQRPLPLFKYTNGDENEEFLSMPKPVIPSLPNLPDLDENIIDDEADDEHDEIFDHDQETTELLNTLIDDKETVVSPIISEVELDDDRLNERTGDILSQLGEDLKLFGEVLKTFDELKIDVTEIDHPFSATITWREFDESLWFKAYLPYNSNAALDLFELAGEMDFISTIGITTVRNEKQYVVKMVLLMIQYERKHAAAVMRQLFSDATKANKIIHEYL